MRINLLEYRKMPKAERLELIKNIKLTNTGNKKSLRDCNNDLDTLIMRTANGYYFELKAKDRLNEKNPGQNWLFYDDIEHGYFEENHITDNKPDLKCKELKITAEVKNYKFYKGVIYFVSELDNLESYYEQEFHNTDVIIIYNNQDEDHGVVFGKNYWLTHTKISVNNKDSTKNTFTLDIKDLKEIRG